MLVLTVLIFLAVFLAVSGLFVWLVPTRTEQRLQVISPSPDKPHWAQTIVKVTGPFARLSSPEGDWETSPLRVKFLNAGIRHPDARLIYFGAKGLLPLLFAALAFFALRAMNQSQSLTLLFYVMVMALVGCYLPNAVLNLKAKARRQEIFDSFPDAADLMLVCVEAGLGLDSALTRVADEIKLKCVPLAEELHLTNLEMRAGATREQSLRHLAVRAGIEEISTFATMLTQADRFGTSIGDSLRVFSDDLRHKRQVRAEERAAKIPTKMLFPLVLFIFPSIIMVILGPALIQVLRTVLPMLSGR